MYSHRDQKILSDNNSLVDVLEPGQIEQGKLEHIVCDFTALVRLLASKRLWNAFCTFQRNTGVRIECEKGTDIRLFTERLMRHIGAADEVLSRWGTSRQDLQNRYRNACMNGTIEETKCGKNLVSGTAFASRNQQWNDQLRLYRSHALELTRGSQAVLLTDALLTSTELSISPSVEICSTPLLLQLFLSKKIVAVEDLPIIIGSLFSLAGDGDIALNDRNGLPKIALRYSVAACVYHNRAGFCKGGCQQSTLPCPWGTPELRCTTAN